MNKLSVTFLALAIVVGEGAVAQAQSAVPDQPRFAAESKMSPDERLKACLGDDDCSTRVRLQIIRQENDEMNTRFHRIHQVCADVDFQNCMGKQKEDVDAWYAAQARMRKMMQSMQTQRMTEKVPAAGATSTASNEGKNESVWKKIWPFGRRE